MKIEFRHYQRLDDDGNPFYYDGVDPLNISKTTIPPAGFTNVYFDGTCDVLNRDQITFEYSIDEGDQHSKSELAENIILVGQSKEFIEDWLSDRVYASQNIIEVKFTDTNCGRVIGEFIIKAQKIQFCTDNPCELTVTAEANNRQYECMAKYQISDNWNGFLDQDYRAWDYVVEKRPKIMTKILYMFGATLFLILIPLVDIVLLINGIIVSVNAILAAFGLDPIPPISVASLDSVIEAMRRMLGFGRTHSAASVAEYTENITQRCGIPIDYNNNLFFQQNLTLVDGTTIDNPYKNMDILFAESQQGRRNDDPDKQKIIPNNASQLTLPQLYNDLAEWANAKWYISPTHGLRFIPRYTFADDIVYDYSQQKECEKINGVYWERICIEYAQDNPFLGRSLEFSYDATDQAGNDALARYNSRAVLDSNEDNPNLKGLDQLTVNFGAARFRDDGINKEFVRDAINDPMTFLGTTAMFILLLLIILNAISNLASASFSIATVIIAVGFLILGAIVLYAAGAIWGIAAYPSILQTSSGTFEKPKLLIWDGIDPTSANVVTEPNFPDPNTNHNSDPYQTVHPYNEDPIKLHNYPVFLDCNFQGTAFSNLHSFADRRNLSLVENRVEIDLIACCEHLNLLGLYQGGETAIDKRIRYGARFDQFGNVTKVKEARTTRITVNYMDSTVKILAVGR